MQYQQLGNTGVFVSRMCLGTMTFGGSGEPWNMIGALERLKAVHEPLPAQFAAFGISEPDTRAGLKRLFLSHPPLDERIAALARLPS